jgi:hypothetical protein
MAAAAAVAAQAAAAVAQQNQQLIQQQQQMIDQLGQQVAAAQQANAAAVAGAAGAPALVALQTRQLALLQQQAAGAAPEFKGAVGNEAHQWLNEIRLYFEAAGIVEDEARILAAARCMKGPAAHWWEQQRELRAAAPPDALAITTWPGFIAAIKRRYEPVDATQWARRELKDLTQAKVQSLASYIDRFSVIVARIADMSEADRVFNFREGAPEAVRGHLASKAHELTTLQANIEAATRWQASKSIIAGTSHAYQSVGQRPWSNKNHQSRGPSVYQMDGEEEQNTAEGEVLTMLKQMQAQLNQTQAQLNQAQGQQNRDRRGTKRPAPPGGEQQAWRIPGLSGELARARKYNSLCIQCGQPGHRKNECRNAVDLTTRPPGK